MRVLVTAFEPFGGAPTNVSLLVAEHLTGAVAAAAPGVDLRLAVLPVTDAGGPAALHAAIDRHEPDAVVCLGEAGARLGVDVELIALNLKDYRIADNQGCRCRGEPIDPEGPGVLLARLPVAELVAAGGAALAGAGVPCRVSRDAGLFLCNQVAYEAVLRATPGLGGARFERAQRPRFAGFVHLPLAAEQMEEVVEGARPPVVRGPGTHEAPGRGAAAGAGGGRVGRVVDAPADAAVDGSGAEAMDAATPRASSRVLAACVAAMIARLPGAAAEAHPLSLGLNGA